MSDNDKKPQQPEARRQGIKFKQLMTRTDIGNVALPGSLKLERTLIAGQNVGVIELDPGHRTVRVTARDTGKVRLYPWDWFSGEPDEG